MRYRYKWPEYAKQCDTPDGHIGPKTIAAAKLIDPLKLIEAICDERLHFLRGLHTCPVFGKGWGRRVNEVRHVALTLAG